MVKPREQPAEDCDTTQRILDAASTEFAARGFEGTTLRRIAERAGVSLTSITYNFRDKETIWREAAAFLYGRLARRLRDLERELASAEPRHRIRQLLIEFVIGASESRIMSFAFEARGSERNLWLRAHYADPIRQFFDGVVEEAQERGYLRPGDPELHYKLLGGASMFRSWRTEIDDEPASAGNLESEAAELVDLLLSVDR